MEPFVYDARDGVRALTDMDRLSFDVIGRGDMVLVEFTYEAELIADRWGTTFRWTQLALLRGGVQS